MKKSFLMRMGTALVAILMIVNMQGCATVANPNPRDPFESFNRSMFEFNEGLDENILQPTAKAYQTAVPSVLRKGVSNFFGNLEDLWSGVNNALQFKAENTLNSFGRFVINTTFGLGGLLDIASEMQMERRTTDFGLTLGHWGVGDGPYVVLPVFGPRTMRDAVAYPVDMSGNLVRQIADEPTRNALTVLNVVNTRANLLQAGTMLNEAALDKYSFMRDLYLQRRHNQLYDGNPPDEEETVETPPVPAEKTPAEKNPAEKPPVETAPDAPSTPSTPPTLIEEKAP